MPGHGRPPDRGASLGGSEFLRERLSYIEIRSSRRNQGFCEAVDAGLSMEQKELPTRFLYDSAGSELFEKITALPEYYLTRCEGAIFDLHAREIVRSVPGLALVEFGSGSSKKTRLLIEAALDVQASLHYFPIDISGDFLRSTSLRLLQDYPALRVTAVAGEYFDVAERLPGSEESRLILFLGSNIGNLARPDAIDFLGRVRRRMTGGDRLLVGVDLVKDPAVIEAAYNDSQGVTERFNKNLLRRINRELDGHFNLARFRHHAPYLGEACRVEMRLYSECEQEVRVDAVGKTFGFREGEFIHTEWSHKYTPEAFGQLAGEAGLEVQRTWTDPRGWFSTMLLGVAGG
jgi:L-histidine Nalpha-methyltransferase